MPLFDIQTVQRGLNHGRASKSELWSFHIQRLTLAKKYRMTAVNHYQHPLNTIIMAPTTTISLSTMPPIIERRGSWL